MKKTIFVVLASFLLVSPVAFASGSSGRPPAGGTSVDPYEVTELMKCTITEIKENGTIMVKDKQTGEVHPLAVNYKTKVSAQNKKAFGGRKELEAADLAVGHELKVVTRQVNGEVLRVKVLKS